MIQIALSLFLLVSSHAYGTLRSTGDECAISPITGQVTIPCDPGQICINNGCFVEMGEESLPPISPRPAESERIAAQPQSFMWGDNVEVSFNRSGVSSCKFSVKHEALGTMMKSGNLTVSSGKVAQTVNVIGGNSGMIIELNCSDTQGRVLAPSKKIIPNVPLSASSDRQIILGSNLPYAAVSVSPLRFALNSSLSFSFYGNQLATCSYQIVNALGKNISTSLSFAMPSGGRKVIINTTNLDVLGKLNCNDKNNNPVPQGFAIALFEGGASFPPIVNGRITPIPANFYWGDQVSIHFEADKVKSCKYSVKHSTLGAVMKSGSLPVTDSRISQTISLVGGSADMLVEMLCSDSAGALVPSRTKATLIPFPEYKTTLLPWASSNLALIPQTFGVGSILNFTLSGTNLGACFYEVFDAVGKTLTSSMVGPVPATGKEFSIKAPAWDVLGKAQCKDLHGGSVSLATVKGLYDPALNPVLPPPPTSPRPPQLSIVPNATSFIVGNTSRLNFQFLASNVKECDHKISDATGKILSRGFFPINSQLKIGSETQEGESIFVTPATFDIKAELFCKDLELSPKNFITNVVAIAPTPVLPPLSPVTDLLDGYRDPFSNNPILFTYSVGPESPQMPVPPPPSFIPEDVLTQYPELRETSSSGSCSLGECTPGSPCDPKIYINTVIELPIDSEIKAVYPDKLNLQDPNIYQDMVANSLIYLPIIGQYPMGIPKKLPNQSTSGSWAGFYTHLKFMEDIKYKATLLPIGLPSREEEVALPGPISSGGIIILKTNMEAISNRVNLSFGQSVLNKKNAADLVRISAPKAFSNGNLKYDALGLKFKRWERIATPEEISKLKSDPNETDTKLGYVWSQQSDVLVTNKGRYAAIYEATKPCGWFAYDSIGLLANQKSIAPLQQDVLSRGRHLIDRNSRHWDFNGDCFIDGKDVEQGSLYLQQLFTINAAKSEVPFIPTSGSVFNIVGSGLNKVKYVQFGFSPNQRYIPTSQSDTNLTFTLANTEFSPWNLMGSGGGYFDIQTHKRTPEEWLDPRQLFLCTEDLCLAYSHRTFDATRSKLQLWADTSAVLAGPKAPLGTPTLRWKENTLSENDEMLKKWIEFYQSKKPAGTVLTLEEISKIKEEVRQSGKRRSFWPRFGSGDLRVTLLWNDIEGESFYEVYRTFYNGSTAAETKKVATFPQGSIGKSFEFEDIFHDLGSTPVPEKVCYQLFAFKTFLAGSEKTVSRALCIKAGVLSEERE